MDLSQFHTRTETFRKNFLPSTTNNWNSTDETIKNIDDRNNLNHIYIAVYLTKYRICTCIPDELTLH